MVDNGTLSAHQRRAIVALLTTPNVRAAAKAAKVSESTLYRWQQDSEFAAALRAAESDLIDAATRRLLGLQDKAINTLETALDDPDASAWLRVRVAQSVLDYSLKLRELRNLEGRLAELERLVE